MYCLRTFCIGLSVQIPERTYLLRQCFVSHGGSKANTMGVLNTFLFILSLLDDYSYLNFQCYGGYIINSVLRKYLFT